MGILIFFSWIFFFSFFNDWGCESLEFRNGFISHRCVAGFYYVFSTIKEHENMKDECLGRTLVWGFFIPFLFYFFVPLMYFFFFFPLDLTVSTVLVLSSLFFSGYTWTTCTFLKTLQQRTLSRSWKFYTQKSYFFVSCSIHEIILSTLKEDLPAFFRISFFPSKDNFSKKNIYFWQIYIFLWASAFI